jgi:hypothetical protein
LAVGTRGVCSAWAWQVFGDRKSVVLHGQELFDPFFCPIQLSLGRTRQPDPAFKQSERLLERQVPSFELFDDLGKASN